MHSCKKKKECYLEPKGVIQLSHLNNSFWFKVKQYCVQCRTLSTWNPKGFYLEPKTFLPATKNGFPKETAQ